MSRTVCEGTHPVLHKQSDTCCWRCSHTKHVYFLSLSFLFFLFCCLSPVLSLTQPSALLSQIASLSPTLYLLFHSHLDFLLKQALSLLNGAFLWLSLSFYPSTWLLSCRADPFILCLWKTHTRTVVKADYSRTAHSVESFFFPLFFGFLYCQPPTDRVRYEPA